MRPAHLGLALAVVGVVAVLLAAGVAGPAPARAPLRFTTVTPGIAHAPFEIHPDNTEAFIGHAFNVHLDLVDLRLVPAGDPPSRRTVAEIVAPYTTVVATNASFFDVQGRAMGLAVDEGRVLAEGDMSHVQRHPRVIEVYLGE